MTNRIASPDCRKPRSTANRLSTSLSSRLDVGSSRIGTLASTLSARAMATSCCMATGSDPSVRAGSMAMFRRVSRARVSRTMRGPSMALSAVQPRRG